MDLLPILPFLACLFVVGFLYASVGHGGASGYLATMALFSIRPELMKSSALLLNVFVSLIAFIQYYRAGYFRWEKFWPFALASIPMAFVGARIPLSDSQYRKVLAASLILVVIRLLWQLRAKETESRQIPLAWGLLAGAVIGLLSGMIGIGGGILLSPLMLLFHWAKVKETAASSSLFILANSISGLIGLFSQGFRPEPQIYSWIMAGLLGGICGSYLGSRRLSAYSLNYLLAISVTLACLKLIFT